MKIPARPLVYSGLMYFGYYLALGAYMPYISLYYERIGMSGVQIGILAALPVLVLSTTTLMWGAISDRFGLHRTILRMALLLSPLAVLLIPRTISFAGLAAIVLVYAFFASPIVPLLDSLTLESVKKFGSSYGSVRVWGSIGWSVSTWVIGSYIERSDIRIFFYVFAVVMGVLFLLTFFQPGRTPSHQGSSIRRDFRRFFRADILIFLASIFLLMVSSGGVYTFFSIYMDRIGAGEGMIGLSWSLASLSEIPVMFLSVVIMRRIGATGLLKLAFFVYALRWFALAFITQPEWALLLQLLHGLSFGSFLTGGVSFMNERAPEGLETTAQAIFSMVTFGLGSITGSLVGGYMIDRAGMNNLFLFLAALAGLGFVLFTLKFGLRRSNDNLYVPERLQEDQEAH